MRCCNDWYTYWRIQRCIKIPLRIDLRNHFTKLQSNTVERIKRGPGYLVSTQSYPILHQTPSDPVKAENQIPAHSISKSTIE